jgi:threonine aldolase
MAQANVGSAMAYGVDDWTQRGTDAFRTLFGPPAGRSVSGST